MPDSKPRFIMRGFRVGELSGVGLPAQEGATVALMKSAGAKIVLMKTIEKFSPDQARDSDGKFSSGGGGGGSKPGHELVSIGKIPGQERVSFVTVSDFAQKAKDAAARGDKASAATHASHAAAIMRMEMGIRGSGEISQQTRDAYSSILTDLNPLFKKDADGDNDSGPDTGTEKTCANCGEKYYGDHCPNCDDGSEVKKFSPDQERDDHGRFSGGGSSDSVKEGRALAASAAATALEASGNSTPVTPEAKKSLRMARFHLSAALAAHEQGYFHEAGIRSGFAAKHMDNAYFADMIHGAHESANHLNDARLAANEAHRVYSQANVFGKFADGENMFTKTFPRPTYEETRDEFVARFMGDSLIKEEYPDEDARKRAAIKAWGGGFEKHITKLPNGKYQLRSKDGSKNLGTFDSLAAAKKHEGEVEAFKQMDKSADADTDNGGDSMPVDDSKVTELSKALDRANRLAELNDVEKAHFKTLTGEAAESYLKMAPADRTGEIKKAADANPVVFTAKSGETFRKSDDPRMIALAKRADDQAEELRKSREEADTLKYTKSAEELKHLPGDIPTKIALLKSIDGIADEARRAEALKLLKAHDGGLAAAMRTLGTTGGAAEGSPEQELNKKAEEYAKANKVSFAKGYDAVLKTPEGSRLYSQIDAAIPPATPSK